MASTASCGCGPEEQTVSTLEHLASKFIPSKWSPCSLRRGKEPGDQADVTMSGHAVDRPAPTHLSQTKKRGKLYCFLLFKS